jgi:uncharacterized membrane-anchored protein
MWVANGVASPRWTPVSPATGEIATSTWKRPFEFPEQPERMAGESQGANPVAARLPQTSPAPADPPQGGHAPAIQSVASFRAPDDPGIADPQPDSGLAMRRLARDG